MAKPLFDLQKYTDGQIFMHCVTDEEAIIFCNFLHDNGRCWCNEDSYQNNACFETFKNETCYEFNQGRYGAFSSLRYNIGACFLEFESFDWSKYGYIDIVESADAAELASFLDEFSVYT